MTSIHKTLCTIYYSRKYFPCDTFVIYWVPNQFSMFLVFFFGLVLVFRFVYTTVYINIYVYLHCCAVLFCYLLVFTDVCVFLVLLLWEFSYYFVLREIVMLGRYLSIMELRYLCLRVELVLIYLRSWKGKNIH